LFKSDAPSCHACNADPLFQWSRLATPQEAERQKAEIFQMQGRVLSDEEIAQRYGPLRVAMAGCVEHHLGNDPENPDSGLELRAVLHDSGCQGHGACGCDTGGDCP
jgi:hypothetical protein